jgi:hypothetical protein
MTIDGPKGFTRVDDFDQSREKKNRSPRVWLLIAGAALALTGAVVGGIAVLNNSHGIQNRDSRLLADIGLASLSIDEVVAQAKDHNVDLYWVGPLEGDRYAVEILSGQVRDLHYLVGDPSDVSATDSYLRVATYPPSTDISTLARGPLHISSDVTTSNARGDEITYNPTDLTSIAVKLASGGPLDTKATEEGHNTSSEEIVTLDFSTEQSVARLIELSEKIAPVYQK